MKLSLTVTAFKNSALVRFVLEQNQKKYRKKGKNEKHERLGICYGNERFR